ncbi:hypothetical protein J7E99_14980 [Streptomyces sp. ISL-44]|uniref:hypothetical protein n=1 Tax=Streptomyces sp. ISL-44 TaxID=2819184 RepID=UPI001BE8F739|nr:hypothetical protein [Streptomyces sp. ISL-44]MBT2541973.1 hypothetical protein [Streptomyces sp. ISL-44]
MEATQKPPYAPGLGDPWQFPGNRQGQPWQPPAPVAVEPIGPQERAQQLSDLGALIVRFPQWFVWFRERRWTATRYTGERVEADSANAIAAQLGATSVAPIPPPVAQRTVPPPVVQQVSQGAPQPPPRSAPPVDAAHPPAAGPPRVPRMVRQQLGLHGTGEPWQPQSGPQYPPTPHHQHAQPIPQASGAA